MGLGLEAGQVPRNKNPSEICFAFHGAGKFQISKI